MGKRSPLRLTEDPATYLPAMLRVPEVAGEAAVYEAIRQGMPRLRIGRFIGVPRAELPAWPEATARKNAALAGSNGAAI